MRKHITTVLNHPLISGSTIVFAGSFIASLGHYFYNLVMGRMLSVSDYGLLTSLSSLFVLLGLFSGSFVTIFAKFAAKYKGADNAKGLQSLLSYGFRIVSIFACIVLVILLICVPLIKNLLHIDQTQHVLFIIFGVIASLFLTLPQGVLQGRMQFFFLSAVNISQPIIKIVVAYILLTIGLGVSSPLIGISLSVFFPVVALYWYFYTTVLKKEASGELDHKNFKNEIIRYSYTSFLAGLGVAVLTNTDILLVRHFFNESVSGQYAALSLMGKAIFYLILPINFAFFPLIAYKREKKERLFSTVLLALAIVLLASVFLSFIYFAFPSLVLRIFFPSPEYRVLTQYLGLFSLYIMVYSLATLLFNFFLSVGRTEVYKISLGAAMAQVILIIIFHNTLFQVIGSMFIVSLLFFIFLLGYYIKHERD